MSRRPLPRRRWTPTVVAVPWAVAAALRLTGTERGFPLVPALAFTPYVAATSVLPLATALVSRSRGAAWLAAASAAALAAAVSRPTTPPPPAARPEGPRLRVVSANMLHGRADAAALVALAADQDADVLALMEVTPEAVSALLDAGVADLLPSAHVVPAGEGQPAGAGGALWTRLEIRGRTVVPGRFGQPAARLAVPGAPDVELTAVHTHPPTSSPAQVASWTADLRLLPDPEPEVLRVLAGDFNATPDHAAFRRLLRRGWVDAATAVGAPRRATWWPMRMPHPRLTLDHVLVDPRIAVHGLTVVHVPGTDHRALVADLRLPAVG
ncbi:endonuclease/exonuclease/phosphatase family protein [Modestobacter marinus]|uniref:Endonuclease/exonuclease/phosphatase (EEP) superfamily protein YafD n=1 Tax=Modestobacter marinus TaxID=477641 RepID=A0A846LWN1_9ACTN|nr:endonuclease/exonuclease/phosphatase family protein [Modestobacter marinus]NIH66780.1 endonuclease/exonuclease/phosphatase (EEP) superfamily protein YafD [Modestobacter marinus]